MGSKIFLGLANFMFWFGFFCLIKVVPTFQEVFSSFGGELPWSTHIVIGISDSLTGINNSWGYVALMLAMLLGMGFVFSKSNWVETKVAVGLFVAASGFLGFIVVALFMPMFVLGNLVQS